MFSLLILIFLSIELKFVNLYNFIIQ